MPQLFFQLIKQTLSSRTDFEELFNYFNNDAYTINYSIHTCMYNINIIGNFIHRTLDR